MQKICFYRKQSSFIEVEGVKLIPNVSKDSRKKMLSDFERGLIDVLHVPPSLQTGWCVYMAVAPEIVFIDQGWSEDVCEQARARVRKPVWGSP